MIIKIEDINFNGFKIKSKTIVELYSIISSKITSCDLQCAIDYDNTSIILRPVEDNKFFLSTVINKIKMNSDDPRIKKLKRNYLNTNRITKKQETDMWQGINNTLTNLGMSANIKFYEHTDDMNSFVLLRDQDKVFDWPLTSTVYPTK